MQKIFLILLVFILSSCNDNNSTKLPILGKKINNNTNHIIDNFNFINQDGIYINNNFFDDKLYIANFFFINCPTICPIVMNNLYKIHKKYLKNPKVSILSHSIDYKLDNTFQLKQYSKKLKINNKRWNLVCGNKDLIYNIAKDSYMLLVKEDNNEPGGFLHSGLLILVDKNRHIRGIYDGLSDKEIKNLIKDIKILLKEY